MDYSKLSNEQLIELLETRDEEDRDDILNTPNTDNLKELYDMKLISIDTSEAIIDSDDYDNRNAITNIEKSFNDYQSKTEELYESLKTEYLTKFSEALRVARSQELTNDFWSPESWFREGIDASINDKEILTKFLNSASLSQKEELFNDYFKLDSDGENKSARHILGIPVNSNTLLYSLDKLVSLSSDAEKLFDNLCFIAEFVDKNGYQNTDKYQEKIKNIIVHGFNNMNYGYNREVFYQNMKNGNKFEITAEDLNLKTMINDLNWHSGSAERNYTINDEQKEKNIIQACRPLDRALSSGLWNNQIKEVKDSDFDFSEENISKERVNTISQIYNLIDHKVAKEHFRSFIDAKSLDMNSQATLDNSQETKRKPKMK